MDRGREGFRLPFLRTVQAGLPHTALQSVVTPSGLTVENTNCGYVNNSYLIMMTPILIIRLMQAVNRYSAISQVQIRFYGFLQLV